MSEIITISRLCKNIMLGGCVGNMDLRLPKGVYKSMSVMQKSVHVYFSTKVGSRVSR